MLGRAARFGGFDQDGLIIAAAGGVAQNLGGCRLRFGAGVSLGGAGTLTLLLIALLLLALLLLALLLLVALLLVALLLLFVLLAAGVGLGLGFALCFSQHARVVFGVLEEVLGGHAIIRQLRIPRQKKVFVDDLLGGAAHLALGA